MSAPVASETRSPVEGQEGDEGVAGGRAAAHGDEQGAEFVAVQADGVGLVAQAGPADVRGGRVIQQVLFHGVPVQPGDGAQPAGDRGPCLAVGLHAASRATGRGSPS
jgi:hypothetical protein